MKIAQVAPLMESVPPRLYGGTERIVSYLTEELRRAGSRCDACSPAATRITAAKLVPCCAQRAAPQHALCATSIPYYMLMLDKVRSMRRRVRHHALPYGPVSFSASSATWRAARVTTLHGRQDLPDLLPLYRRLSGDAAGLDLECAARSRSLTRRLCRAPVHHGLPRDLRAVARTARRLSRVPRPHLAREAASTGRSASRARVGIAAEDRRQGRSSRSRRISRTEIEPAADGDPRSSSSARSTSAARPTSSARRAALLFPIDWPEPFGLVDDRGHGLRHARARFATAARCPR